MPEPSSLVPLMWQGLQWRRQLANKLVLQNTRSKLELERHEMTMNASLKQRGTFIRYTLEIYSLI